IQAGEPILATPDINQSPFWRTGRSSALVCVGSDALVRISTAAREAGWTLPGTLSLCSILEPGRQADSADCTSYEIPVQTMAEWVVELLLSAAPGQSPRVV